MVWRDAISSQAINMAGPEVSDSARLTCLPDIVPPGILCPVSESLGQRVKRLRIAAGFKNQQELATALGVTQSAVSDWERGRYKDITVATLLKILRVLKSPFDSFLDGLDPEYDEFARTNREDGRLKSVEKLVSTKVVSKAPQFTESGGAVDVVVPLARSFESGKIVLTKAEWDELVTILRRLNALAAQLGTPAKTGSNRKTATGKHVVDKRPGR